MSRERGHRIFATLRASSGRPDLLRHLRLRPPPPLANAHFATLDRLIDSLAFAA